MSRFDPVAAIAEGDAAGEIAETFSDIRACLGVPVVNLIWRHLATIPGALPWAWQTLRPLHERGALIGAAARLRSGLEVPESGAISTTVLTACGLSPFDVSRINFVVNSYERSNAVNLLSMATLLAVLDNNACAGPVPIASRPEDGALTGEMPALPGIHDVSTAVGAVIDDLDRIGGRDGIVPTMYRHLSHWPVFLGLAHVLLVQTAARHEVTPLVEQVKADGFQEGNRLAYGIVVAHAMPAGEDERRMRAALEKFFHGPLCKMVAIVALIKGAMTQASLQR